MRYAVTGAFCEQFSTRGEAEEYLRKLRELAKDHPRIQAKLDLFETKIIELPEEEHHANERASHGKDQGNVN